MRDKRQLIGRPRSRQLFSDISLFRDYQNRFLKQYGPTLTGDVIEIGGQMRYRHSRFFPNASRFTVSNIARDFEVELDATNLPFDDDTQDAFVCVSVLPHMPEPRLAIQEMHRTLRPGGDLLLVVPFLFPVCDEVDFERWTPQGLESMLAGFDCRAIVHLGGRISSVVNLLQRPVGGRSRRYLVAKFFGVLIAATMGRFDQVDDSPIGIGIHAVKAY